MRPYLRPLQVLSFTFCLAALSLPAGSILVDTAFAAPETGAIAGRVFLDENADTEFQDCDCDCGIENIPIRLYRGTCGGLIVQTVKTDAEGFYLFPRIDPGNYCLMPEIKINCEGYLPTKSVTQKVAVKAGETTQVEWFAYDHYLEVKP
jgi:hypothetical protein